MNLLLTTLLSAPRMNPQKIETVTMIVDDKMQLYYDFILLTPSSNDRIIVAGEMQSRQHAAYKAEDATEHDQGRHCFEIKGTFLEKLFLKSNKVIQ